MLIDGARCRIEVEDILVKVYETRASVMQRCQELRFIHCVYQTGVGGRRKESEITDSDALSEDESSESGV